MAKTRKPSRKELKKDDEFVTRGQEVVAWASQYSRQLIVLTVGLVVIVTTALVVSVISSGKAAAAASALGGALEVAERPILEADEDTDLGRDAFPSEEVRTKAFRAALEEVREEHARTPGGALAALYLAKIAAEEDRHEDALSLFEAYLSEAPRNHRMRFSALEGIGAVHEAREDLEAALAAYERLATEAPSFYVPFGLLHKARILVALDRHDEARAEAQRILDEHGGTPASRRARDLLGRLPSAEEGAESVAAAAETG